MQKRPIQQRPSYAIESVDNVLRLLQMLRDENAIRVSDAALELDVAPSTAHRLLSMLVYRGFAIQDESRRYLPGLGIGATPIQDSWTKQLRAVAKPLLQQLRDETGETIHLSVRSGTQTRFLLTVESLALVRVGELDGAVLQSHRTAAGIALLSHLADDEISLVYRTRGGRGHSQLSKAEFTALMQRVSATRRLGYAVNSGLSDPECGSIGFALHLPQGSTDAALTIAAPLTRFEKLLSPQNIRASRDAVTRIDAEFAAAEGSEHPAAAADQ